MLAAISRRRSIMMSQEIASDNTKRTESAAKLDFDVNRPRESEIPGLILSQAQ